MTRPAFGAVETTTPGPYRLLLTTWQSKGAGSIQSVQYLARGLLARGHQVWVACPADGVLGRRLLAAGVPVVPTEFGKGWSLRSARHIAETVRRHGIQLVDAQESRDRKAAILARHVLRVPARLVITRRQMTATFPLVNALYARAADRIIAISHGVADDLVRHGMPRGAISVVHTGLDPRRIQGDVDPAEVQRLRQDLGLDPALRTVGVVARRKNQETLLRAAALLDRPLNLLFAGIERDAALADLEAALPVGTRVAYTGFVDRVLPPYRLIDVHALTTTREGLSQANLEAMGLGIPAISAAAGGTPELIRDGKNGLLFAPGDAADLARCLRRVLDDPALAARLVAEAKKTVATEFHADSLVTGTEAVYRELLDGAVVQQPREA